MPNTDIIDDIVSTKAFERAKGLKKLMGELEKQFIATALSADKSNASLSGVKGIKEMETAAKKLNDENLRLVKIQTELAKAEKEKSAALLLAAKAVTEKAKAEKLAAESQEKQSKKSIKLSEEEKIIARERNKEVQARIKTELAAEGSINKLAAQVVLLRIEYYRLTEAEKAAEAGQLKAAELAAVTDELNKQKKGLGDFSSNVGNYANSLADGFEVVRREINRLKSDREGLTIRGDTRGAEAAGRQIQQLDNILKVSFDNTKSFDQVVKQLGKDYSNLAVSGQASNAFLQDFKKFVAQAKDQAGDLKTEIKALGSDTRSFDLLAGSINFAADSFQLIAGAAQLAGVSEKDAAQATATLTAVMSVSNGVKGIATELTKKGTAANLAYAFVQRQVNIVMAEGIATAKGLRAAFGLLGIVVTVVGAIAAAFGLFKAKVTEAEKAQKALNETIEAGKSAYAGAIVEVDNMNQAIQQAKAGIISKEAAVKQYNETIGKTTGEVKNLDEAETAMTKNADRYIEFQFLKAQANFALGESAKLAVEEQVLAQKKSEALALAGNRKTGILGSVASFDKKTVQKAFTEAEVELNKSKARFDKIKADINKKLSDGFQDFAKADNKFQDDLDKEKEQKEKDAAAKSKEAAKKKLDENKKLVEELKKANASLSQSEQKALDNMNKKNAEDVLSSLKSVVDDERNSLEDRLLSNSLYYQAKEQLIKNLSAAEQQEILTVAEKERAALLGKKDLSTAEKSEIFLKTANQRKEIEQKSEADILAIKTEGLAAQNALIENTTAAYLEKLKTKTEREIAILDTEEAEQLTAIEKALSKKEISQKEYEKRRLQVQEEYAAKRLLVELKSAEDLLAVSTGPEAIEAAKKIAEIKLKIAEETNKGLSDINKKSLEEEKEIAKKKKELWNQLGQEIKQTIFAFIDAGFERQKNNLEREKNLIDERKDAELKRINALNISEADKADRIKILEANVQAQKEQIARRQKQLDIQKARFDKLKAIADIGIATAVAVVKSAATPFLIPLIIAIGALQLARVIATPIPEYYTGTEDSKGGLVWLGERGKELLQTPDGKTYETPGKATMASIPEHSKVIANPKYEAMLRNNQSDSVIKNKPVSDADFIKWQVRQAEKHTDAVVNAIKNKSGVVVNVKPGGVEAWENHGYSWSEYIDKRVRFRK